MIRSNVRFILGLNGPELEVASLNLDAAVVGGASGPYGTRHLLQLGRHFDHYYDRRRRLPVWQTRGIYSSLPRVSADLKSHANDVSGQIGECCGALVMRRIVGLSTSEIEPLVVDGNRKTPDFRVFWNNASDYLLPEMIASSPPLPIEWPLESKSRPAETTSLKGFYDGLQQIATYWLLRGPQLPGVIGFGLISVTYDKLNSIDQQRFTRTNLKRFQARFKRNMYEVSNLLAHCQESP